MCHLPLFLTLYQENDALAEQQEFEEELERMRQERELHNKRLEEQAVEQMEAELRSHVRPVNSSIRHANYYADLFPSPWWQDSQLYENNSHL